ncbi:hypothetical protein ACFZAG_02860 [Streptomyces sp. NPDC012403]|uniref:hypothetical protein n=1 Tax=Streptomyces sp. NPDC012403 TaxID=3364831 RepID=UPI0036E6B49C
MFTNLDVTTTAPDDLLPGSLIKLIEQRDQAVETLQDFEDQWAHVLRDDFLTVAEAADTQAAISAARAGKDVTKLPSEVDKVRSLRPRIKGAQQVLAAEARSADKAVATAYRPLTQSLEPKAMDDLRERVTAAEGAYSAYLAARAAVGEATALVAHLRDWATGGRTDFLPGGCIPRTALGVDPVATEPVAQLREILRSFEDGFTPDPLVTVRSKVNGAEFQLPRSKALALVGPDIEIIDT